MPKLPTISGKNLLRIFESHGFIIKRTSGSHFSLRGKKGEATTIPVHGNKDLHRGTLKAILRDIDLSTEDFLKMIKD